MDYLRHLGVCSGIVVNGEQTAKRGRKTIEERYIEVSKGFGFTCKKR